MRGFRVALKCRTLACVLLVVGACAVVDLAQARQPDPWTPLRTVPVFHDGRIMPLDTFARQAVTTITGRERPRLKLLGEVFPGQVDSPQVLTPQHLAQLKKQKEYQGALELFPQGQQRRFDPLELLLSWLVRPEDWEHVPFILCEHEELRKALKLPVLGPDGTHLRYVSPAFLSDSPQMPKLIRQLRQAQREAQQAKRPLRGLPALVQELYQRYTTFRHLTARPDNPADNLATEHYLQQWQQVAQAWLQFHQLTGDEKLRQALGIQSAVEQAQKHIERLFQFAQYRMVVPAQVDAEVVPLRQALDEILGVLQRHVDRAQQAQGAEAQQLQNARRALQRMVDSAQKLRQAVDALQVSVYRNAAPLRLVPALDAQALETDRGDTTTVQPWLDWATLVFAPEEVLRIQGYPISSVRKVRKAYQELRAALLHAQGEQKQEVLTLRAERFAEALHRLGLAINPLRERLPVENLDREQLLYTAYPNRNDWSWGSSWRRVVYEVRYNRLDPFKWAWVVAFLGTVCYALSFGRLKRVMFWLGSAIMLVATLWGIYGFYLRVAITTWAPVTNMYETIIYVALVVAVLGLWFTFLPVFWDGIARLWKLSAFPLRAHQWQQIQAQGELGKRAPLWAIRAVLAGWVFWTLSIRGFGSYDAPMPLTLRDWSLNSILVWLASLTVVGTSMWVLPRAVVALVLGFPWGLWQTLSQRRLSQAVEQAMRRLPFAVSAAAVSFILWLMAWWAPVWDTGFASLSPVLRNNFWLTVHVLTIVSSYGAGALAWVMSVLAMGYYLFGRYRDPEIPEELQPGFRPAAELQEPVALYRRPPEQTAALAHYIYKTFQVAVLLLIAGTILGGLWADVSWGRFWGWDPKEVWALISALVYLAILHGRYVGWFGNFGMAAGAMAGMSAIAFSWFGVNFVLGAGLHSYGFVDGGLFTALVVFGVLGVGWLLALAAWLRYAAETSVPVKVLQPQQPESTRSSQLTDRQVPAPVSEKS